MAASKEIFLQMRAEDMVQMYDATFTKKEAIKTGETLVKTALENGNVGKHELMGTIVRLKAVIDSAEAALRSELPQDNTTVMGVEFKHVNGGKVLNYDEDPVYAQMKKDLKHREELLKAAKSGEPVLDGYGNEVPVVGTTERKSSINIKF